MAKRVFFSFHYDDVESFRANVVRNHGLTKDTEAAGFFDASMWEDAEAHGAAGVKRLIDAGLENTSATCVLIGSETWQRSWVRYEILKSYDRGNKMFGVHINSIPDKYQRTFNQGPNPFAYTGLYIDANGTLSFHELDGANWKAFPLVPSRPSNSSREYLGKGYTLSNWVPVFEWTSGEGYKNFASWVESAK